MQPVRFGWYRSDVTRLRDETYAARRQHILDAARACFSRKGFHAASMLDLQAEAGVSAGAIYVYFPSKDDIIEAITEENLRRVVVALTEVLERDPAPSLAAAITDVLKVVDAVAIGPTRGIAFDVWGESSRNETIGAMAREHLGAVRALFVELARRAIKSGELPQGAGAAKTGAVLFSLCIFGYYGQRLVMDDITPAGYARGMLGMLGA